MVRLPELSLGDDGMVEGHADAGWWELLPECCLRVVSWWWHRWSPIR
jgi:hypothetical protein